MYRYILLVGSIRCSKAQIVRNILLKRLNTVQFLCQISNRVITVVSNETFRFVIVFVHRIRIPETCVIRMEIAKLIEFPSFLIKFMFYSKK